MSEGVLIEPIGWMRCGLSSRYETPRQPSLAVGDELGCVELRAGYNFEQALIGVETFTHLWLVYGFHLNPRPDKPVVMIKPPRHKGGKVGVFATRAPHRPNGLGLSCVAFERIEGRRLYIRRFDLLDGSPIFDIKPYVPAYDVVSEASSGWLEARERYRVQLLDRAAAQALWLADMSGMRLDRYARVQLQEHPLNDERKRIHRTAVDRGRLAYREWDIHYRVCEAEKVVWVEALEPVASGSSDRPGATDDAFIALRDAFVARFSGD